jgi:hypothetical protein
MDFLYTGFTQDGDCRCYRFDGKGKDQPKQTYDIAINLSLFAKHQIAFQHGPALCLQILRAASATGPDQLERYQHYRTTTADFTTMLAERAAAQSALTLRKAARRTYGKAPGPNRLVQANV